MSFQALPGFRDFYPDAMALRSHIFATWRRVAASYGFEEFDGPPLEPLDLFTAKSGQEIVDQLYAFEDKGGRTVALRPEMTPTLARMVGARGNALKKPIRWFAISQLFRYERQQRGRLREHFQLNCDILGEAGPVADAEIIALALDAMRAFGLTPADVRARISDRRVLEALLRGAGIADDRMPAAFQAIDKVERMSRPRLTAMLTEHGHAPNDIDAIFRVAEIRTWDALAEALDRVPGGEDVGGPLRTVMEALEAMGLGSFVDLDLSIVRGLDYYTGIVFELFDAEKTFRAICGGGRYDTLLKSLGGTDLPALGFGMGDVVLGDLLADRGLVPPPSPSIEVFVAGATDEDLSDLLGLVHAFRDRGIRVEYSFRGSSLGKQLGLAASRGARFAVVIGPDDRARGEVVIKTLTDGSQRSVARAAAVDELASLLAG
ncbi:MAG TPA: histidine--tRNA ligase [Gemmatimonadales bacterium]|nr:histidine--tRNA ligase [Gemmatimonadales bacterium]